MKHLIVAVVMAAMAVVGTEVRANNITYSGSLFLVNPIVAPHSRGSFTDTFKIAAKPHSVLLDLLISDFRYEVLNNRRLARQNVQHTG